jgi:hypothetical protein
LTAQAGEPDFLSPEHVVDVRLLLQLAHQFGAVGAQASKDLVQLDDTIHPRPLGVSPPMWSIPKRDQE